MVVAFDTVKKVAWGNGEEEKELKLLQKWRSVIRVFVLGTTDVMKTSVFSDAAFSDEGLLLPWVQQLKKHFTLHILSDYSSLFTVCCWDGLPAGPRCPTEMPQDASQPGARPHINTVMADTIQKPWAKQLQQITLGTCFPDLPHPNRQTCSPW